MMPDIEVPAKLLLSVNDRPARQYKRVVGEHVVFKRPQRHHLCVLGFYNWNVIVISSFCYGLNEDFGPLGCYTALIGGWLQTF
jgi:hypothetical protein